MAELTKVQLEMLQKVADLKKVPTDGAFNIRLNGKGFERHCSEHIGKLCANGNAHNIGRAEQLLKLLGSSKILAAENVENAEFTDYLKKVWKEYIAA